MSSRILVLGGTGMLGRSVVQDLVDKGHTVRILTRNIEKTHNLFGDTVEITEGMATNRNDIQVALAGYDTVPTSVYSLGTISTMSLDTL